MQAQSILKELDIEYVFYPVLVKSNNSVGFEYDRPRINELAVRTRQKSLSFQYPRIFVDGKLIGGYLQLKQYLGEE
ncbi:glutaredoxin [Pectobacterium phage POP12]|nr:glutaredoxin [Pectobacterium phage POP12]